MHEIDFLKLLIKNGWIFKINNYKKENYNFEEDYKKLGEFYKNENGFYVRKNKNIIGGTTFELITEFVNNISYIKTVCDSNEVILYKINIVISYFIDDQEKVKYIVSKSEIFYSHNEKKRIYFKLSTNISGSNITIDNEFGRFGDHEFKKFEPIVFNSVYKLLDPEKIKIILKQVNYDNDRLIYKHLSDLLYLTHTKDDVIKLDLLDDIDDYIKPVTIVGIGVVSLKILKDKAPYLLKTLKSHAASVGIVFKELKRLGRIKIRKPAQLLSFLKNKIGKIIAHPWFMKTLLFLLVCGLLYELYQILDVDSFSYISNSLNMMDMELNYTLMKFILGSPSLREFFGEWFGVNPRKISLPKETPFEDCYTKLVPARYVLNPVHINESYIPLRGKDEEVETRLLDNIDRRGVTFTNVFGKDYIDHIIPFVERFDAYFYENLMNFDKKKEWYWYWVPSKLNVSSNIFLKYYQHITLSI